MARSIIQDERIQLERYKAGYYAFIVGGVLFLVYYFLWSAVEFHDSWMTGIMPHLVLVGGSGTFYVFRMKNYNKALREERWLRRKQQPYYWLRLLSVIPAVVIYVITYDYFSRVLLGDETPMIEDRWVSWLVLSAGFSAILIYSFNAKPESLDE